MHQDTLDKEILKTIIDAQEKHIFALKAHIVTLKQLIQEPAKQRKRKTSRVK